MVIEVLDGSLAEGDVIDVVLGDTTHHNPGSKAQSYADEKAQLRVVVDPFATGRFHHLATLSLGSVVPGDCAALVAMVDSEARAGSTATLVVRATDHYGNVAISYRGRIHVTTSETVQTVATHHFSAEDAGVWQLLFSVATLRGALRLTVSDPEAQIQTESNPLVVFDGPLPRSEGTLLWGDTQGQTGETVGTGSLDTFFSYARRAAKLDFVAHSANDFQVTTDFYKRVLQTADAYTKPGEFVAFGGFEWSGNTALGGDHNVIYADSSNAPLHRSSHALLDDLTDLDTDRPTVIALAKTLRDRGTNAIMVPHVGGRLANLDLIQPTISPVVEIVSVHGWFEWFARDALRRDLRVGFLGASDDHTCRPGASYPSRPAFGVRSGLGAVYAPDLTRESVLAAIRARHCYATTGERIHLMVHSGSHMMGDAWESNLPPEFNIEVYGTSGIEAIDLYDKYDVVAHWSAPLADCKRRLRVAWTGARGKGRSRFQCWDGSMELTGASITTVQKWAFDHPDQGIVSQTETSVSWRSNTSGDWDGLILGLEGIADNAHVRIMAAGVDLTVSLAEIDVPVVRPITPGIDRSLELSWVPAESPARDVSIELAAPSSTVTPNAYFVRVRQDDGHLAWSSPVFVERSG
ncbi:MAG: DUF3604 domain-containing protein [Acidimicrobiales bacterium]